MSQENCPFCQLIANPSQLKLVGETENFYAWLEINPRAKGYTMIVPKEHKDSIEDFTPEEYSEGMGLAREIVDKAKNGLKADGASITLNINEAAGQMVPHAYIQVFPRFEDEETAGTPTGAIFQPDQEAKENLDKIHEKMKNAKSDFGVKEVKPHPESQKFKEDDNTSEEQKQEKQEKKSKQEDKEKKKVTRHESDGEVRIGEEVDAKSFEWS